MLKLYTDDSPGLKVDPVIVLVLSLGFIFSVVALHSMLPRLVVQASVSNDSHSNCKGCQEILLGQSKGSSDKE